MYQKLPRSIKPDRQSYTVTLADLGIIIRRPRVGENRAACPQCATVKARPRDDALGVTIEAGGAWIAFCRRCSWAAGSRGAPAELPPLRPPAPPVEPVDFMPTWRRSLPIEPGTVAAAYLRGRGCALPHARGDLRYLVAERHPSGHVGPALVALVTSIETTAPMSIMRTWLAADGSGKAAVDKPRMLWKGASSRGAVVRLWPDDEITTGLAIGEGIETALALARGYGLAWSTIDANGLASFPVLPGIEALTVAVDNDPAGLKAAGAVTERWTAAGREVRHIVVPEPGADLADLAKGFAA